MINMEGIRDDSFADSREAVLCAAETAECGCPDRCDRDHGND